MGTFERIFCPQPFIRLCFCVMETERGSLVQWQKRLLWPVKSFFTARIIRLMSLLGECTNCHFLNHCVKYAKLSSVYSN